MTLTNFYTAIAQLSGWLLIVTSLLALGMRGTPARQFANGRCAAVTVDASNHAKKSD